MTTPHELFISVSLSSRTQCNRQKRITKTFLAFIALQGPALDNLYRAIDSWIGQFVFVLQCTEMVNLVKLS